MVVAAGVLAGAIAFRRRFGGRTERIDLYYEDGSIVSLPRGSPEGDQLLPLARDVLRVSRS
ncbi:MAG: hypothetical protein C5B48_15545 [Candidatus Rokuibacteriota bacterium]|nr:MAG: hypothetical protein C5B48_15545 [Candidatus Rokubacteria bacterium]